MAWILRDQIATWEAGEWNISVDLNTDPRLSVRRRGGERFFAAVNPQDGDEVPSKTSLVLADAYVRNRDLVAAYPEKAPLRFGYETYVSVVEGNPEQPTNDLLSLECWLSVQTSTLEAYPQLGLALPPNSKFEKQSVPGVYLSGDKRVAILVHPLDATDAKIEESYQGGQSLLAFGRFMEKGVIRRLRVRIVLSEQSMDDSCWQQCQREFAESPLPLTT